LFIWRSREWRRCTQRIVLKMMYTYHYAGELLVRVQGCDENDNQPYEADQMLGPIQWRPNGDNHSTKRPTTIKGPMVGRFVDSSRTTA
jgi:hypothetical protein